MKGSSEWGFPSSFCDQKAQAFARYFARDWDGAIAAFARSEVLESNRPGQSPGFSTNPSLFFGERARHHRLNPPPEEWNGVYAMSEK